MDINPFSSFRKYQKFWMACILLLCMVTFVLCTGQRGGDAMDWVNRLFGQRGGPPVITVNGVNYDYDDVLRLKENRNVADAFMKRSNAIAIEILEEMYKRESKKEVKKGDERAKEQQATFLATIGFMKQQLQQRNLRKRYFDGGVKLDDLANFLMWRAEADRLGIHLERESILAIYNSQMLNDFTRERFGYDYFSSDQQTRAHYDIRSDFRYAGDKELFDALGDEYRVRMAQLAMMQAQVNSFQQRGNPQQGRLPRTLRLEFPLSVRAPLSPEQLWEKYESQRSEFDVRLLPINVEHFVDKVQAAKNEELAALFEQYKTAKYDPASPTPGFEIPHRVKAGWVMADANSKAYRHAAQTALLLETFPLVWNPTSSALDTLVRFTVGPAALDAALERDYEGFRKRNPFAFMNALLEEKNIAAVLLARAGNTKPPSVAVASLTSAAVGNPLAGVTGFYALVLAKQPELPSIAAAEQARRAKLYDEYSMLATQLAASGLTGPFVPRDPFMPAALTQKIGKLLEAEQFLPLPIVREEMKEERTKQTATAWAQKNMSTVRETLARVEGKQTAFELQLEKLIALYHLEHGVTKDYYDRFKIDKAPELKPLLEAFDSEQTLDHINIIEGRARGSEQAVSKGDFARLFFDTTLPFSAAEERFRARPWPPVLEAKSDIRALQEPDAKPKTIDLFESADKPILFWKIEDKSAEIPASLDVARKAVEDAWKTQKARKDLAIPYAQEVAESLQKSGGEYLPILEREAEKLGSDMVVLTDIAPLSKIPLRPGFIGYHGFQLPADKLVYPVDKMADSILTLHDLKQPIKTGNEAIDNINKNLFNDAQKMKERPGIGKYVQILTNKPQTAYYVAAVTRAPVPDFSDFRRAYQFSVGLPDENNPSRWTDDFIDHTQAAFATEYRDDILAALKQRFNVKIDEERSKDFDN